MAASATGRRSWAEPQAGLHRPVLVTLVHLRLQLPHAALAELYGVTRPNFTRHPRDPPVARRSGLRRSRPAPSLRLRTLADLFAHAQAEGVELRIDDTETQVRRPQAGRAGRKAFVSGKEKQNTAKTTTRIGTDAGTPTWWTGPAPRRWSGATVP
ncbi:hypothetical protein ACI2L1_25120 [Streptomyces sp. NPDC019531]|uniref:hypothetical protein n=1 Tax=Streptomyces sp. NPDC019531 TaxID=3365062 RepID=UPI00384FC319